MHQFIEHLHTQCICLLLVPFFLSFVAMIELSWKLQFLVQTSYNSEFYCAKVTKEARVYYAL